MCDSVRKTLGPKATRWGVNERLHRMHHGSRLRPRCPAADRQHLIDVDRFKIIKPDELFEVSWKREVLAPRLLAPAEAGAVECGHRDAAVPARQRVALAAPMRSI